MKIQLSLSKYLGHFFPHVTTSAFYSLYNVISGGESFIADIAPLFPPQQLLSSINYQNSSQQSHSISPIEAMPSRGFIYSEFRSSLSTILSKNKLLSLEYEGSAKVNIEMPIDHLQPQKTKLLMIRAPISSKIVIYLPD